VYSIIAVHGTGAEQDAESQEKQMEILFFRVFGSRILPAGQTQ
tara:strand:+ start:245 stop:373 length:129 start_codon:yes stop_codon:yes gene_type:complete